MQEEQQDLHGGGGQAGAPGDLLGQPDGQPSSASPAPEESCSTYRRRPDARRALGIDTLDLLTNNPDKARQLRTLGLTVRATRPTGVHVTPGNLRYLHAKAGRTHHTIALPQLADLADLAG
ncbi:hypothetical protein [Nonomuraea sp. SYSU D8015]|uniref:hypothetical protein n=1 Tax=Nonomuraea sp. SYSU D8015 TaxID=2593644 RepID=UPI0016612D7F|nr:hypothetical protein [Nonomuraea sp. SYSU D8015]